MRVAHLMSLFFFFFNDTATTEIYTLSLHDALPISASARARAATAAIAPRSPREALASVGRRRAATRARRRATGSARRTRRDRKSTRLNSSHVRISYAVFCLKKKKHYVTRLPSASHA